MSKLNPITLESPKLPLKSLAHRFIKIRDKPKNPSFQLFQALKTRAFPKLPNKIDILPRLNPMGFQRQFPALEVHVSTECTLMFKNTTGFTLSFTRRNGVKP
jgi:hypothetical protein